MYTPNGHNERDDPGNYDEYEHLLHKHFESPPSGQYPKQDFDNLLKKHFNRAAPGGGNVGGGGSGQKERDHVRERS